MYCGQAADANSIQMPGPRFCAGKVVVAEHELCWFFAAESKKDTIRSVARQRVGLASNITSS